MDGGRQGEGVKRVKISGCDREHEAHEMLVEHFKVSLIFFIRRRTMLVSAALAPRWWYQSISGEILTCFKTSPSSAREAAMSAMQHETFFKHLERFLETFLKHFRNTLENHETPLKHPWNFLFHETFMKHSCNFLETPLKLPQNTLQSSLILSWNIHVTSLKHPWKLLRTPLKLSRNTLKTP